MDFSSVAANGHNIHHFPNNGGLPYLTSLPTFSLSQKIGVPSTKLFIPSLLQQRRYAIRKSPAVIVMAVPAKYTGVKSKKVVRVFKLNLEAGKATPAPPVGPALGSKGVNIMEFCKEYNALTADKAGWLIPAEVTVYDDKSFTLILKKPPASKLLLKAAGVEKGSEAAKIRKAGKITLEQLRAIAIEKLPDLNCRNIEAAMRTIAGTAHSMGIEIDPPMVAKTDDK